MNYKKIVSKIESLPPLLDTADTVRRLYSEGSANVNLSRLTIAIESDALLSANVLKMINSPLYGFSRKIDSVSQAVTLFGSETIFALVLRFCVQANIVANLRPYGVGNDTFNEVCHLQSKLVSEWYTQINPTSAAFLAPLALIMESGKLILAKEITASGEIKEFLQGLKSAKSISLYEHEYFTTSSYFVSGLLFEHWNLNDEYVAILKGLDYEHTKIKELQEQIDVLDTVRRAINVSAILSDDSIKEASKIVAEMGHSVGDFISAAKKLQKMRRE